MVMTVRQRVENISDGWVAGILLGFFAGAVIVSLAAWRGSVIEFRRPFLEWADSIMQNFGMEMLGAFLTFILLEVIRGSRERKAQEDAEDQRMKATQELMRALVQMQEVLRLRAAKTREEQQAILDIMVERKLLQGASLSGVKLQGAILNWADLQEANLFGSTLQGASLQWANLQGASLYRANLQETRLDWANLQKADLRVANLRGANLQGVKYLTVEQLRQAEDLEGATLPDGTTLQGRMRPGQEEPPWREVFETWCETVETDEKDRIIPADVPAADPDDDE